MTIDEIKSNVNKPCHQYRVKRLDLFGSKARGDFETYNDLDFLVEFIDSGSKQYSKLFFGLLHSLEDIFQCNIDLLTIGSIKKQSLRKNYEQYSKDRLLKAGIERKFEIIGEALNRIKRLDEKILIEIREYRSIISFRNILTHGYDFIEEKIVWGDN